MVKQTMGMTEWGLVGLLALLWSGSFFFVEVMLEAMDPTTAVLLRVAPAAVALTIVVYAMGHRLPGDWASWRVLIIMGLLNNVAPFSLIAWGQTHMESGLAAILNATTPLFTVLLAHWLTGDERMTINRAAGVLVGLVGIALLDEKPTILSLAGMAVIFLGLVLVDGRLFRISHPARQSGGRLRRRCCSGPWSIARRRLGRVSPMRR